MASDEIAQAAPVPASPFIAADIAAILRERGWLAPGSESPANRDLDAWLARAAELLGPQAPERTALAELLALIFNYDAAALLNRRDNQILLARTGAREVIRALANRVLEGGDIDSERFKQIVDEIKATARYRSRAMFHPMRLALAGRAGDGELDRVILLLDGAARLNFAAPVKGTRQRMLEFCAALD